ncbi:MAG: hypothetical protein R3E98_19420 [Gemmatimonadota bacterium]
MSAFPRLRAAPRRAPLLAVLLLLTTACASGNPRGRDDVFREGNAATVQVDVLNLNFADATLWALRGGQRVRLGIARGKQEATFTIPWDFSMPLQVEIDLLAGQRCFTESIDVDPGDVIYLELHENLGAYYRCR